jgi:hypothetical protein
MTRWWHEGYDDQTQSDYLRYYFTIAFSKQYARAVGWYELMDRAQQHNDPTRFGRGLLDENLNPRPVAYVMRNLIRSWTTTMNLTTDSSGIIRFRGFAGNYLLLVPDYQNATFHVTEGRLNTMEAQLNSKETVSSSTNTAILSMNAVLTTLGTVILAATILLYLRVRMRNRVVR